MIKKLKSRWGIESNWQFWVIMLVFSITGMATLWVRRLIFPLLGITEETSFWIVLPIWLLVIFPIYQLLFLLTGTLFGQFRFVWEFEKRMFSRIGCGKKKQE